MTKRINKTLLGTPLACSHLKRHYDPLRRMCGKCGMPDEEIEDPVHFNESLGILGSNDILRKWDNFSWEKGGLKRVKEELQQSYFYGSYVYDNLDQLYAEAIKG